MIMVKKMLFKMGSLSLLFPGILIGYGLTAQAAGPEPAGWYAGDMHVHRSCGDSPVTVSSIYNTMIAQDLSVVSLLADMGNGEVQNPTTDLPKVNGGDDSVSTSGRIVHWDTEWHWDATSSQYPHQAVGGHIVALGLTSAEQIWEEYTYPIFDWAHQQGGIAGFAHMQYLGESFPQSLSCCLPIEYPVEVALGACDFVTEDVEGGDTAIHAYYRLLNCGFRPGLAAGSDYPCGTTIGQMLTYSRVAGGSLTYSGWIDGIAKGRTAVSRNGRKEFLDLKVNGSAMPGDEIQLPGGESVPVNIQWTANQNLAGTIELVCNGEVVASKVVSGVSDSLSTTVDFTRSGWLCARRMSDRGHEFHTAAVFVTVDQKPVRTSVTDAQFYVQWMDNLLQNTSPGGIWSSYFVNNRAAAQARYNAAKSNYQQIVSEAETVVSQPLAVTTASLLTKFVNVVCTERLAAVSGTLPYTWSLVGGSLPPGLTFNTGKGTISGTPTTTGTFSFNVQVADANSQTATKALSITITSAPTIVTIWPSNAVPGNVDEGADNPVELGVKFKSDVAGTIVGIRFYKGTANTGTHIGNLWTSTGTLLGTATFANETASGWQQVLFATPMAITSNTVYVASYHANNGHYSADASYFSGKGVDNPPLHALTNSTSSGNGVYAYGASSAFPNQTWNAANYWVDVMFQAGSLTLTSIAVTPANSTIGIGVSQQFTATGNYSDGSTQNLSSQVTWTSSNTGVATINASGLATGVAGGTTTISATLSGVSGNTALTVQSVSLSITTISLPAGVLNTAYSTSLAASGGTLPYTWSLTSGSLPSGLTLTSNGAITGTPTATGTSSFTVQVRDANNQTATKTLSITITSAPTIVTIWPNTTVPGVVDQGADSSVELGVKFKSDVAGRIVGIRFYKGTANTGTHIGNLWTSNGTRLATATFSNETASGWQQVLFATSVTITNNTVYVASYHANNGHYSVDNNYFSGKGVDNPPLHALTNTTASGNGVYAYGTSSAFPNQTYSAANYWVDVMFQAGSSTPTLTSIAVTPANSTIWRGASQQFTATGTYSDGSTQNLSSQVTWTSSNTGVATINASGLAMGVAAGMTTISAALSGVSNSTTLTVQVPPTLTSIVVTPANSTIGIGVLQQFTATGNYSDSSTQNLSSQVTWTSSSAGVATITTNGLATGVAGGTTTISATLSGVSGNTALTVQSVSLSITTISLPAGVINTAYSTSLAASGGTLPYTWSLTSGSLPSGLTLTSNGAITGTPTAAGTSSFTVQVRDANNQTATKALSITITSAPTIVTIWPSNAVPGNVDDGADNPVELGVKFKSDVAGTIVGIRFYKGTANTGTHIGNLWASNGTRLVTATFSNETASGWQQLLFATPVTITNNTVYVASYHANNGHYSADANYFTGKGMDNPPLHALTNTTASGNGVYAYGTSSAFPNQTYQAANYWVDVMFQAGSTPPPRTLVSIAVTPVNPTMGIGVSQQFTATGTYSDSSTQNLTTQVTWTSSNTGVATITTNGLATGIAAGSTTISAALSGVSGNTTLTVQGTSLSITTVSLPTGVVNMAYSTSLAASGGTLPYTWSLASGSLPSGLTLTTNGVITGTPTAAGTSSFTVRVRDASSQTATKTLGITITTATPSGLILVVTNAANPFSQYYGEILLTEGLNEFDLKDVSSISSTTLASYEVVILGQVTLQASQVNIISNWVNAGGNLIAMRPDKKLAGLLGLVDTGNTLSEGYLLVNTATGPGAGIVGETIQFHGTADRYTLGSASKLATLYSNPQTATVNPAVTLRSLGSNGGQAAAFTYDLAQSIVYTRQGNPAWAGQDRDGIAPCRSDDLFYGAADFDPQPDWVNLDKAPIPQADEQQRLLANLIITMDSDRNLLPRFWYFPHGYEAVVVMTGDDHGGGGTADRFAQYMGLRPANGSVADWETIRSSSYVFVGSSLTDQEAAYYNSVGFEIGLHLSTSCADYTRASLITMFSNQLSNWINTYPSLPAQTTHRAHCIAWSDYTTMPEVEALYGIRLDVNYYYWPGSWVLDRPGFFTGSGMPMRFATASGNLINVYQAATVMTDESDQSYPETVNFLLDRAFGEGGYYGAFVANAHTDSASTPESDEIVGSAINRGVPVISPKQLLTWLDARNASSFRSLNWNNDRQTFSVTANANARGLLAMAPIPDGYSVNEVRRNGSSVDYYLRGVKGFQYAMFRVTNGNYEVSYESDSDSPSITERAPASGQSGVGLNTNVSVTFSEAMDASTINSSTITLRDSSYNFVAATVSYNASSFTAVLTPSAPLAPLTTYTVTVKGGAGGVADISGNPLTSDEVWSFTTTQASAATFSIWPNTAVPGLVDQGADSSVELGVKFKSDVAGTITGIRFYKAAANTGTHVGNLWSSNGTLLATATFANETASGWQQVLFATPVTINSNTVYVASYHVNSGHYSQDNNYFSGAGVDNPPLHALANGVSGSNGVYRYGTSSIFPNQSTSAANYWVDVVFKR